MSSSSKIIGASAVAEIVVMMEDAVMMEMIAVTSRSLVTKVANRYRNWKTTMAMRISKSVKPRRPEKTQKKRAIQSQRKHQLTASLSQEQCCKKLRRKTCKINLARRRKIILKSKARTKSYGSIMESIMRIQRLQIT